MPATAIARIPVTGRRAISGFGDLPCAIAYLRASFKVSSDIGRSRLIRLLDHHLKRCFGPFVVNAPKWLLAIRLLARQPGLAMSTEVGHPLFDRPQAYTQFSRLGGVAACERHPWVVLLPRLACCRKLSRPRSISRQRFSHMGSALVKLIPLGVGQRREHAAGWVHVVVNLRAAVVRQESRTTTVKQLAQCHPDNCRSCPSRLVRSPLALMGCRATEHWSIRSPPGVLRLEQVSPHRPGRRLDHFRWGRLG